MTTREVQNAYRLQLTRCRHRWIVLALASVTAIAMASYYAPPIALLP